MPENYPFSDFISSVLEEEPRLPYYSYANQQAKSPGQRRFFESDFSNFYNQYLGQLGTQLMGGQDPTLKFTDYLGQTPFTERFSSLPPQLRGENPSRYNPFTRWLT